MRAHLIAYLSLLCALSTACAPTQKCGGELYYDPDRLSCRPCPSGARFDDGTCICPEGAMFTNHRCVGGSSAAVDAAVSPECAGYCELVQLCLVENEFAQSVVPDVVSGLNTECPSDCAAAGGGGQLASCIAEGREAAACEDNDSQEGLRATIMLLAQCSRAHAEDPLRPVICVGLRQSALVANQIDFCD